MFPRRFRRSSDDSEDLALGRDDDDLGRVTEESESEDEDEDEESEESYDNEESEKGRVIEGLRLGLEGQGLRTPVYV